jgi:hypothetical protein
MSITTDDRPGVPPNVRRQVEAAGRPVIIDFQRERARRRPAPSAWRPWASVAVCLTVGIVLGRMIPSPPPGPIVAAGSGLAAAGPLSSALAGQLASDQAGKPVQIGLSFRSRDGRLCRTFQTSGRRGVAGFACRDGRRWAVRMALAAPTVGGQAAASKIPPALLTAVDAAIRGDPLSAPQEAAARAHG